MKGDCFDSDIKTLVRVNHINVGGNISQVMNCVYRGMRICANIYIQIDLQK